MIASVVAAVITMQTAAPIGLAGVPEPQTVIVLGRRAADIERALAACIARGCPPKEDVALSQAHAEAQLVAGDYKGSRRTLLAAIRRNRNYAAELPVEIAELHRANARLASLTGLRSASRAGSFDVVDTLKAGLGKTDNRVLQARLEVGSQFARDGRLRAALDEYAAVARDARKLGENQVEGLALFQSASLLMAVASANPIYRNQARVAAAKIERSSEPSWAPFRDALRVLPAVFAGEKDRPGLLDDAARAMTPRPVDEPFLFYAPSIDLRGFPGGRTTEWVDLRYRIAKDGTVTDAIAARMSPNAQKDLVAIAQRALEQRRYAPQQLVDGALGPVRTERVSFVSDFDFKAGSRIPDRAPRKAEGLDLTAPGGVPAVSPPSD